MDKSELEPHTAPVNVFEEADAAFEPPKTPWPSPDADLLDGASDWWLVARMDMPLDRWLGYVGGYWKAASVIADRVAATSRDQDYLVYPFLMCWRHYVELQLKNLIGLLQDYERESGEFPRTHKLDLLWKQTRRLLEKVFPNEDPANIVNVERILTQLQSFDPTSEHFRYPITKDGSETLDTLPRVHIRTFHEAMEGLAHFFDAVDTGLRQMLDDRNQYESEMHSMYGRGISKFVIFV